MVAMPNVGLGALARVSVLTLPETDGWMVPQVFVVTVPLMVPEPPSVPPG